jgi:hypothetical protein
LVIVKVVVVVMQLVILMVNAILISYSSLVMDYDFDDYHVEVVIWIVMHHDAYHHDHHHEHHLMRVGYVMNDDEYHDDHVNVNVMDDVVVHVMVENDDHDCHELHSHLLDHHDNHHGNHHHHDIHLGHHGNHHYHMVDDLVMNLQSFIPTNIHVMKQSLMLSTSKMI